MTSSRVPPSVLSACWRISPAVLAAIGVWFASRGPVSADDEVTTPPPVATAEPQFASDEGDGDVWELRPSNSGSISGGRGPAKPQPDDVGGFGVNARAGHIAGDTIDSDESRTFIELAPFTTIDSLFLGGDFRFLRTNEGDFSGTGGLIVRRFIPGRNAIFGTNLFFDVDDSHGAQFQQVGFGFEWLTNRLDNRTNVYLPYGDKTKVTSSGVVAGSGVLTGNSLYYSRYSNQTTAAAGVDTMFTMPIPGRIAERINLELSAGAYYFAPNDGGLRDFAGPKFRADATLVRRLLHSYLEVTNDNVNDTLVSFGVDVNYWNRYDERPRLGGNQFHRITDYVRRNWNIVTSNEQLREDGIAAINPATGLAYHIEHVDSNATALPGDGTYERPYTSLQIAQGSPPGAPNTIIYAHAGSVFNTPLVMNDGEIIVGEGSQFALALPGTPETVLMPVTGKSGGRPTIDGINGTAVTLADNTTLSGFLITNTTGGPAILGDGITNTNLSNINVYNVDGGPGIVFRQSHGQINLNDVGVLHGTLTDPLSGTDGDSFVVDGGNASILYTNSRLENQQARTVRVTNGARGQLNMASVDLYSFNSGTGVIVENSSTKVTFGDINLSNGGTLDLLDITGDITFVQPVLIDNSASNAENATGIPLQVNGSSGTILFSPAADVFITNRPATGVDLRNVSGTVHFAGDLTVQEGNFFTPALVWQENSGDFISDGVFTAGVSTLDSPDQSQGILIGDRAGLLSNLDGSTFTMNGQFNIFNTYGNQIIAIGPPVVTQANSAIEILNDPTRIRFNGGVINGRNPTVASPLTPRPTGGIEILGATGAIAFNGTTLIDNEPLDNADPLFNAPSLVSAVDIQNSTGAILFDNLRVISSGGGAGANSGVLALNNGDLTFNHLDVIWSGVNLSAAAVEIRNNGLVTAKGGNIVADPGNGLILTDNEELAFTVDSVTARLGINGVEVSGSPGHFVIAGNGNAGGGGIITLAVGSGISVDYTGQDPNDSANYVQINDVELNSNFNAITANNLYGITLNNVGVANTFLTDALSYNNVVNAGVFNSRFVGNAGTVFAADMSIIPTDQDFAYQFEGNRFTDTSTISDAPMVRLRTQTGSAGAGLDLIVRNNGGPTSGFTGFTYSRSDTSLSNNAAAFDVHWNGPITRALFERNSFAMIGDTNVGQTAVSITNADFSSSTNFAFRENSINAGAGEDSTGVFLNSAGTAYVDISGNQTINTPGQPFRGITMLGERAQAFQLTMLNSGNIVNFSDNEIHMFNDNTIGLNLAGVGGDTSLTANGNLMRFHSNFTASGPGERGFRFGPMSGTYYFYSNRNNRVLYDQPDIFSIAFPDPFNSPHVGTIIINNQRLPTNP
ncbi:MAG: beta strand repeat-containing protein [Planctomycetaceae bacterium]